MSTFPLNIEAITPEILSCTPLSKDCIDNIILEYLLGDMWIGSIVEIDTVKGFFIILPSDTAEFCDSSWPYRLYEVGRIKKDESYVYVYRSIDKAFRLIKPRNINKVVAYPVDEPRLSWQLTCDMSVASRELLVKVRSRSNHNFISQGRLRSWLTKRKKVE